MKCGFIGCKNPKIPKNFGMCHEHNKPKPKPSVLSALTQAVAAHYKAQGDRTMAGVSIACSEFEPVWFYAAVVRYPDGLHKNVVISVDGSPMYNVETCIEILAAKWYALVKPAPVQDTLENLRAALDGTDGR